LVEDSAGVWKIDYEAFACVCVPSWDEILDGREMGGKVRVVFHRDNYFNGRYQEGDWVCYRLTSLGSTQAIYGYCRSGSVANMGLDMVLGLELDRLLIEGSSDQPARRALIEIVREAESLPNQFEITRVLSMDWVMGLRPFGLSFQSSAERAHP
jgi:hypothetical protein